MLATPTTQEIATVVVAQIESALAQTVPVMPKAFVRVLAKVFAGVVVILYKYAGWIALQLFVQYASAEESTINGRKLRPLIEWGRLIGVDDPEAATAAEMTIEITVENQTGTLDAGAHLVRRDTQIVYQTQAAVTLDAPTKTVSIVAVSDPDGGSGAGTAGNLEVDDTLEFANPLPNIAREATVTAITVTGADAEETEDYRARIFERFRARPQGGAYADYVAWAKEVPGIIGVYPYTGSPGEVDIYCEASLDTANDEDGTPTAAQLSAILAAINLDVAGKASRRPVNAAPNVLSITRQAIAVIVSGLDVPDELVDLVRSEIQDACEEFLRSRAPFIVGLSVLPRDDRITRSAIGGIVDSVVSSYGGTVTRVELAQDGVDITAFTLGDGEKAKLDGDVQYI